MEVDEDEDDEDDEDDNEDGDEDDQVSVCLLACVFPHLVLLQDIIDVDFDFFDPKPIDFHAVKHLLANLFEDDVVDLSELADFLVQEVFLPSRTSRSFIVCPCPCSTRSGRVSRSTAVPIPTLSCLYST